jgi:hypothetical protein
MNYHRVGNAVAALLFMVVAIVDLARDDSGVGTIFAIFGAVFLGLALSPKARR